MDGYVAAEADPSDALRSERANSHSFEIAATDSEGARREKRGEWKKGEGRGRGRGFFGP